MNKVLTAISLLASIVGSQTLLANSTPPTWTVESSEYPLRVIHAYEAWRIIREKGIVPGAGTVIADIDNGIVPHPEIFLDGKYIFNILLDKSYDFQHNRPYAIDTMEPDWIATTPGHGTSVIAALVSPPGKQPGTKTEGYVTGVTPGAMVIPYRVQQNPIILNASNVVNAIRRAIEEDVDIINLSMGGFWTREMEDAIQEALEAGVIICAAGGQIWPFVPAPGNIEGVIGVTGINRSLQVTDFFATGSQITIAAPGVDINYAAADRDKDGNFVFDFYPGTGSSFATPYVSGAASLWLSMHGGRKKLIQKYGRAGVPKVFRHVLTKYGYDRPLPWDYSRFGVGYLNIEKLLKAPLPPSVPSEIGGMRATPFQTVGLAYQGYLEKSGIPSAQEFCNATLSSRISAQEVANASYKERYIPESPDDTYIAHVQNQMQNFCR